MEKRRYMVMVNRKYLVSVESTSNGGAEHVILDNIRHSTDALAFDDITTDMYKWAVEKCETVSYDELVRKDRQATAAKLERLNTLVDEAEEIYREMSRLTVKLIGLEGDWKNAELARDEFANTHGLKIEYTRHEIIEALRA